MGKGIDVRSIITWSGAKAAERRVLFWLCIMDDRPTYLESPCNSDINSCFETLQLDC